MTTPLRAFSFVQTFGSPWHGLVKSGALSLPNGQQIDYPQPSDGDSVLVKFDGVPSVQRSAAQLSTDADKGKQWLNYAIIAGGAQLHGKSIPSKWLHRDEQGQVWSVTFEITPGDNTSLTVILKDFGRIGLNIVPRDDVTATVSLGFDLGAVTLLDVRKDGRQAAFLSLAGDRRFFTITIDGLTPNAELVRDAIDTIKTENNNGSVVVEDPFNSYLIYFQIESIPGFGQTGLVSADDLGSATTSEDGPFQWKPSRIVTDTLSQTRTVTQHAFYSESGALKFLDIKMTRKIVDQVTTTEEVVREGSANLDRCSTDVTGTASGIVTAILTRNIQTEKRHEYIFEILVDGSSMSSQKVTGSQISTVNFVQSDVYPPPYCNLSPGDLPANEVVIFGDGGISFTRIRTSESNSLDEPIVWQFNEDDLSADHDLDEPYYYGFSSDALNSNEDDLPAFRYEQKTNKLATTEVEYKYQPGFLIGPHIAPDAINNDDFFTTDPGSVYATYHPATFEIVRDQDSPVAFV